MELLKFSAANAKTKRLQQVPELSRHLFNGRKVYSLDLLSGWSCPGAKDCLARVHVLHDGTKRVIDGLQTKFRCFSASQEALYPGVYNLRKHNFNLLRRETNEFGICNLILRSIPKNAGIVRYHVGGEFFSLDYLKGAILAANVLKNVLFYGYTKSLHHLWAIRFRCEDLTLGMISPNFLITASEGGKYDSYIKRLGIRTAKVVFSENETDLPIDHDDSHAATIGESFALLLHGIQPKGSQASKALVQLKSKVGAS